MTPLEFIVHVGAGYGFGLLMWELSRIIWTQSAILNAKSKERAYNICGQAIIDYEFGRGVHGVDAYNYAHFIMRGGI